MTNFKKKLKKNNMWIILKFVKKDLNLLKRDISVKIGKNVKFYIPKIKIQKFKKNKLYNSEVLLLGDYILCYHSNFKKNQISNSLQYCRGLKYFLNGFLNSQKEIDDFVKKCLKSEDNDGYIKQSFFSFDYNSYKKYKFLSGPFTNMIFKIIDQQKNKIKILLGKFKTTVSEKEYLFRPV